jgi:hypothetical protein
MIVFIDGPLCDYARELYDFIAKNKIISSNKNVVLFDDIDVVDIASHFNPDTKCIVLGSPISMLLEYKESGETELYETLLELIQSKEYVNTLLVVNIPKLHEEADLIAKYNLIISENMMFLNDPLKFNQIQYQFDAMDENVFKLLFREITHYLQINN